MVSLNDFADRAARVLADGETTDLGGKRVRFIDMPHMNGACVPRSTWPSITGIPVGSRGEGLSPPRWSTTGLAHLSSVPNLRACKNEQ